MVRQLELIHHWEVANVAPAQLPISPFTTSARRPALPLPSRSSLSSMGSTLRTGISRLLRTGEQ